MEIKEIFERLKSTSKEVEGDDEYIELDVGTTSTEAPGKILIHVDRLNSYADSDRIQRKVREGNIVLARIKELKDKDINELKRAISRIQKTCTAINGDIAGVADGWLIVTPSFARVNRPKSETETVSIEEAEEEGESSAI